jgi:hypothetical protein
MPAHKIEVRPASLVDIPLILRLTDDGIVLDSRLGYTADVEAPQSHLFSSIFLPQRGLHTWVARSGDQQVVAQFRLRPDETNAQLMYVAPPPHRYLNDTVWLHLLDAMTAEAGRRGAHILTGEVHEESRLFETMRTANFAVYARQAIWRRATFEDGANGIVTLHPTAPPIELTTETDADAMGIQALYVDTVPSLVQPVSQPPLDCTGLVYRKNDRIEGYLAISEGKHGIYITPYLHPDIYSDAPDVLATAIARVHSTGRFAKVPVYVRVSRYQNWLEPMLNELDFELWAQQAVMVRHIAAGIRTNAFAPLERKLEAIPRPVRLPASRVREVTIER